MIDTVSTPGVISILYNSNFTYCKVCYCNISEAQTVSFIVAHICESETMKDKLLWYFALTKNEE